MLLRHSPALPAGTFLGVFARETEKEGREQGAGELQKGSKARLCRKFMAQTDLHAQSKQDEKDAKLTHTSHLHQSLEIAPWC